MTAPGRDFPSDCNGAAAWRPGKLWSLWDIMLNFQVGELCHILWIFTFNEQLIRSRLDAPAQPGFGLAQTLAVGILPKYVPEDEAASVRACVAKTREIAKKHGFEEVSHRVMLFDVKLQHPITWNDYVAEMRVLRETLENAVRNRHFYCYPAEKGKVLIESIGDWKPTLDNFKSAANDILAGVDCWALGHGTASIFHLMRTAEYGLRALARERRVRLPRKQVLEWADWRTIIEEINKKADAIANKRRGPAREAALEFYRGALVSFEGFKDAYRNNVMHARKSYNDTEALAIMQHVRAFMNRLASKIEETGKKQIKWGIR
jgi:hypothetical protein